MVANLSLMTCKNVFFSKPMCYSRAELLLDQTFTIQCFTQVTCKSYLLDIDKITVSGCNLII